MLAVLADTVSESTHVILAMLVVGGVFLAVIALGEVLHTLNRRRKARRRARRPVY
jgi:hypothetical protein